MQPQTFSCANALSKGLRSFRQHNPAPEWGKCRIGISAESGCLKPEIFEDD
jgi:hypothetical protein